MTDKLTVGAKCSFFHEGGAGKNRWVVGWRVGILIEIPARGKKWGMVRIEIPVAKWERDNLTGRYKPLPNEKVWVPAHDVNELGDTTYRGPRLDEIVQTRKEEKQEQQAKADKIRARGRRFHR